jgi:hypothetical protein
MRETWLKPNRRAIWFGCVFPLIIAAIGCVLITVPGDSNQAGWRWAGAVFLISAALVLGGLLRLLFRAPIRYQNGYLLFQLRSGPPIAVPVHIVEAFFLGQGPANLPGDLRGREKAVNLVARLAQRHTEWAQRDVKPAFGNWSGGYVTIRGTWCEPLNSEVIRRLNRRLNEVKTEAEQATTDAAAH